MVTLGIVLAITAYVIAAGDGSLLRGVIAATLVLIAAGILAVVLAGKRAIGQGLIYGVTKAALGERMFDLVFAQLLGVDEGASIGDRGGVVARSIERVPLAQASARLRGVVQKLVAAQPTGGGLTGGLRRRLQTSMLEKVEQLTLARFRDAELREGGVDLVRVRDELAGRTDALIAAKIQNTLNRVTLFVVTALAAGSIAAAVAIRQVRL
jgi:hypothetical protein